MLHCWLSSLHYWRTILVPVVKIISKLKNYQKRCKYSRKTLVGEKERKKKKNGGNSIKKKRGKKIDPARIRTWNPLIRSQMPYPLGHRAVAEVDWDILNFIATDLHLRAPTGLHAHTHTHPSTLSYTCTRSRSQVSYASGCKDIKCSDSSGFSDAVALAKDADFVIYVGGTSKVIEGEGNDRSNISLPGMQADLITMWALVTFRLQLSLLFLA